MAFILGMSSSLSKKEKDAACEKFIILFALEINFIGRASFV